MLKSVFFIISLFFINLGHASSDFIKIKKIEYGRSYSDRPLNAYKIFSSKYRFKKRSAMLVTEGIHGNEYKAVLTTLIESKNFKENIIKHFGNHFEKTGLVLYLIPKLNPDGISSGSRFSSLGTDMNRDFTKGKFLNQESTQFVSWIKSELKAFNTTLDLALDYHCCGAVILPPTKISITQHSSLRKGIYRDIALSAKEVIDDKIRLSSSKKTFGKSFKGTLKDYIFNEFNAVSMTFEAKNMQDNTQSLTSHLLWWSKSIGIVFSE